MSADLLKRLPSGLINGLLFFAFVIAGALYIVFSKLSNHGPLYVTSIPVLIMIGYALVLGVGRFFRLRDDQSGDNLYYMGFLFTLTSLAVSLYQFSSGGSADDIVRNFGIAIGSTIAGIALRIFFNQMRRDPIEVEHNARLELADASRKVRRELDSTALEFSYFRRSMQQSVNDMIEEMNSLIKEGKAKVVAQLDNFATSSSKPIEEASRKSGDSLEHYNARISSLLETVAKQVSAEGLRLSKSTGDIVSAMDRVAGKLADLQTPDQIIEIKLNPMVQGLSKAVGIFSKSAEAQTRAIESTLKHNQDLSRAINELLIQLRASETQRPLEIRPPTVAPMAPEAPASLFDNLWNRHKPGR